MDDTTAMMTTGDVARAFHVTRSTVKRWADAGRLPHSKTLGGQYRFRPADVERIVADQARTPSERAAS